MHWGLSQKDSSPQADDNLSARIAASKDNTFEK